MWRLLHSQIISNDDGDDRQWRWWRSQRRSEQMCLVAGRCEVHTQNDFVHVPVLNMPCLIRRGNNTVGSTRSHDSPHWNYSTWLPTIGILTSCYYCKRGLLYLQLHWRSETYSLTHQASAQLSFEVPALTTSRGQSASHFHLAQQTWILRSH